MSRFEYAGEMYLIANRQQAADDLAISENRQQAVDDSGHGGEQA